MNAGLQLPPAAVRQHAAAVGDAADQMTLARSAVHAVTMERQAYGQLCQFLPTLLSPLFGGAVEVLNAAVDALSETALKLHETTTTTESTDADNARRFAAP